ncbi:MAG: glycoside hydrolase family 2 protein, partial [Bacteroidetes bacterium]|nr:glycoside hydrolase family 2 protein [Bacteroidota bacterium]
LNIQEHKTDSAQIGALVRDAYNANMNMIRVWGGGIYQDDYFYEQCDKLGMLVWQDFMFACAMYPSNENFLNSVKAESEDQLERLKQHPSIALWCGNNEVSEGWDRWGWKTGLDKKELKLLDEAYNTLFLSLLPEQVKKHTSVPYHASSPSFGRGDERYLKEGDAHDWWVWHDAYPFEHFQENIPRFMSEFGFQSIPQESTLRQAIAGDLDTNNVSLLAHQKHHKGFPTISTYLHRDFNKSNSFQSYAYLSRVQQARGIGMGIRAQRLAPQCMGSLYWQLNDCWPAVSWSSIDSEGQWKALHYEARRANAPFAFDVKSDDNNIHYGISSLEKYAYYGVLRLELFDEFGEKILQQEETAELEYLDGATFDTDKLKNQACYATLSFIVNDELIASENFPLIEMKQLQVIDGSSNLKPIQEGEKFRFDLKSAFFTYGLEITANVNGTWSDNFLCLAPGEARSIYFTPDKTTKEIQFQAMSLQKTILK